ncbi:MAG: PrsW family intramembrane metalloprotease [Dermabacter sp.]|nr:PrsW family intramembrane metalloprotease [Dermabacter sp.]
MNQPPSPQGPPLHHPRPGTPSHVNAEHRYYEVPRMFDTRARSASGLTGLRHPQPPVAPPTSAQPPSAWATQQRRVQELAAAPPRLDVLTFVGWGAVAFLLIALMGAFALLFSSFDPGPVFAYTMIAAVSLVTIIGVMLLADRWHPQPIYIVVIAVLWGAAIATSISAVINAAAGFVLSNILQDPLLAVLATTAGTVPLVEEITKGLGVLLIFLAFRKHFNGPLDGIIIGALVGAGFAFTENILYYVNASEAAGVSGALLLAFFRGGLGIFGHSIYTSLTGLVIGLVARRFGSIAATLSFVVAVIPGILLHALWNFGATMLPLLGDPYSPSWSLTSLGLLYGSMLILVAVWIALIIVVVFEETKMTRARLGEYANKGWLTHEEVTMLGTWKGRREGKRWARGFGGARVMKRFIRDAADLAFTRQRLTADGGTTRALAEEQRLLNNLTKDRHELVSMAAR